MHVPKHGHWLQTKVILREAQGRLRVVGAGRPFLHEKSDQSSHFPSSQVWGQYWFSVGPSEYHAFGGLGHRLKCVLSSTEPGTTARIKQPLLRCLLALASREGSTALLRGGWAFPSQEDGWEFTWTLLVHVFPLQILVARRHGDLLANGTLISSMTYLHFLNKSFWSMTWGPRGAATTVPLTAKVLILLPSRKHDSAQSGTHTSHSTRSDALD